MSFGESDFFIAEDHTHSVLDFSYPPTRCVLLAFQFSESTKGEAAPDKLILVAMTDTPGDPKPVGVELAAPPAPVGVLKPPKLEGVELVAVSK
jgi:hypothetical protein